MNSRLITTLVLLCVASPLGAQAPASQPGRFTVPADADPKQVVKAFYDAVYARDAAIALALCHSDEPGKPSEFVARLKADIAVEEVRAAVREQFGLRADREMDIGGPFPEQIAAAEQTITGDEATVSWVADPDLTVESGPGKLSLRRIGGRWRILAVREEPDDDSTGMMQAFIVCLRRTLPEIPTGKYTTPMQVAGAARDRLFTLTEADVKEVTAVDVTFPAEPATQPDR